MRLLTHNLLACHARSCNAPTNFPLQFKDVSSLEVIEAEQNFDFLTGLIEGSKLDYKALVGAAKQVCLVLQRCSDHLGSLADPRLLVWMTAG